VRDKHVFHLCCAKGIGYHKAGKPCPPKSKAECMFCV
jgi:hypothetical protein